MKKIIPLFILLSCFGFKATGQHYQRIVNEITACNTLACVDSVKQQYKPLKNFTPQVKELGLEAQRVLLDFDLAHGGNKKEEAGKKEKAIRKSFRLSMFVQGNKIEYGQLEQLNEVGQLETTYLFKNNSERLEKHVEDYNKLHQTRHSYIDLIKSVTTREPIFWLWIR